MSDTKNILLSRTFWGAALVLIAAVFQGFGIPVTPDVTAELSHLIYSGVEVVGGLLALYGRLTATRQVTVLPQPPAAPGGE